MNSKRRLGRLLCPQIWVSLLVTGLLVLGFVLPKTSHSPITHPTYKKSAAVAQHKPPKELIVRQPGPDVDCLKLRCIALTFDDGPNPITTPQILSILEQEQVHASFFVVGSRINGKTAIIQRMYEDGDEIGNHSWTHPDLTKLTPPQIQDQVNKTQQAIVATGVPAPTLFRPPYGAVNAQVLANIPMTMMFWNEDPRDWAANTPGQVLAAVMGAAHPGGVIDMHDIYHVTVGALPAIIDQLRAQQYNFVTVSQLLNLTPGEQGEFFGRPYP